jgi:hypothetical protein
MPSGAMRVVALRRVTVVVVVVPIAVVVTMMVIVALSAGTVGVAACIGAPERAERFAHLAHIGAEPFEHRLDDVVSQDEDARVFDRRSQVAVADVPCELGQVNRIAPTNLEQFLLGRDNACRTSVIEDELIAVPERQRFGKIDQHPIATGQCEHAPP